MSIFAKDLLLLVFIVLSVLWLLPIIDLTVHLQYLPRSPSLTVMPRSVWLTRWCWPALWVGTLTLTSDGPRMGALWSSVTESSSYLMVHLLSTTLRWESLNILLIFWNSVWMIYKPLCIKMFISDILSDRALMQENTSVWHLMMLGLLRAWPCWQSKVRKPRPGSEWTKDVV